MPLDPSIPLAGRQPQFSLFDLGDVLARRQQLQGGQLALDDAMRQRAEQEQIRQAYAAQYGDVAPGLAPQAGYQPQGGVQEQQVGGAPTAAFPGGVPPPAGLAGQAPWAPGPGAPGAPGGLAGMAPQMGQATGQQPGQAPNRERQFIRSLYALSPKAGRDAEAHAYTRQKQQMDAHLARVEYLGKISRGVLESNTQQAWDVGRRMLLEAGMSERDAPAVYDPQLVRFYANTAEDAAARLAQGKLALDQAQFQRAQAQAPDYGFGQDVNAALYAKYGHQIPPGGRPTPAMVADVRAEEFRKTQEPQLAAAGAAREAAGGKQENELRDEFIATSKDYRTQAEAYGRVIASGEDPSAAGDLSLIFNYMKLLDPGSVVRESEFATAQNSAGVPDRLRNTYNRLLRGERLAPNQRKDFLDRSGRLYTQATKDHEQLRQEYSGLATRAGVRPAQVVPRFGSTAAVPGQPAAQRPLPTSPEAIDAEIADIERQLGVR